MKSILMTGLASLGLLIIVTSAPDLLGKDTGARNLVQNPGFELMDESGKTLLAWRKGFPREEIAPLFELDSKVVHSGRHSAKLTARGSPGTFGYWATTVKGIQATNNPVSDASPTALSIPGTDFLSDKSYRISCYFKTKDVESIGKSVAVRISWNDEKGREVLKEYILPSGDDGDWQKAERILTAPRSARSIDIELVLQWSKAGTVWWDDLRVEEAASLPHRKIKVATVSYQPPAPSTPAKNRQFYAEKAAEAGRAGADILCLGEGITVVSTGKKYDEVAETVAGPTSQILGQVAKTYRMYIVAGIYEREGALVYNTSLLIGRNGEIVGKYRKIHLPETEISGGLTPGDSYPVFKTDFGTIGLQVCYDNFFPEGVRTLALQGAEIIFLPIWGDGRGEGYQWDIVARARAIDNAVFLIASIYTDKRSLIIDPNGHILADTSGKSGMVMSEIDLDQRTFERWLSVHGYGDWKNLYPKERRPDTYQNLSKDKPIARSPDQPKQ
ncbi:MAG TPA: carbon-nitrogen hydrolase family protein [Acidobacteriota bacterium]